MLYSEATTSLTIDGENMENRIFSKTHVYFSINLFASKRWIDSNVILQSLINFSDNENFIVKYTQDL